MENKKKLGMILLILGFIILLINAVDYLSGFFGTPLDIKFTSSGVGAILFISGMFLTGIFSTKKKR